MLGVIARLPSLSARCRTSVKVEDNLRGFGKDALHALQLLKLVLNLNVHPLNQISVRKIDVWF
eukprot:446391-Rhodomonas_salina.1